MDDEPRDKNDPFGLKRLEDPEFERRERSRFVAIDPVDPDKGPSEEIQQDFRKFFTGKLEAGIPDPDKKYEIDGKRLLIVFKSLNYIDREYYKPVEKIPFTLVARSSFYLNGNGTYEPGVLEWYAEDRREHVHISFSNTGERNSPEVTVDLRLQGRGLGLNYSETTGELQFLLLLPHKKTGFGFTSRDKVQELKENKVIKRQTKDLVGNVQADYSATYDPDTNLVTIRREENGELKDEIKVPATLDIAIVKEELFPRAHFNNPYETDPEEDISWKRPDLLDILKIKWQRH